MVWFLWQRYIRRRQWQFYTCYNNYASYGTVFSFIVNEYSYIQSIICHQLSMDVYGYIQSVCSGKTSIINNDGVPTDINCIQTIWMYIFFSPVDVSHISTMMAANNNRRMVTQLGTTLVVGTSLLDNLVNMIIHMCGYGSIPTSQKSRFMHLYDKWCHILQLVVPTVGMQ